MALFAKEARFYRFWVFFRASSLQNEIGDPPFFFFYISDITNSSSFNGKISRKKSMLEKFGANVLKRTFVNRCLFKFVQMYSLLDFSNLYEGLFSTS